MKNTEANKTTMHPQHDKRMNVRLYFSAPKTVTGTTVIVQQMTLVEWVIWPPLTVSFWTNILEVCRATSTHCMVLSSVTVKEDQDDRGGYPERLCCPPESLSALCQGPLIPPFLGLLTYGWWGKYRAMRLNRNKNVQISQFPGVQPTQSGCS